MARKSKKNVVEAITNEEIAAVEASLEAAATAATAEPITAAKPQTADQLEASTALALIETEVETAPVVTAVVDLVDFKTALANVSVAQRTDKAAEVLAAFADRMSYENRERPGNESIQVKLKAAMMRMSSLGIAGVMAAAEIEPNFVNRSVTEGRRYNVYAFEKINDLMGALSSGSLRNAVNIVIVKSLFKFADAGLPFNGVAALAACSDKVKVEKGMLPHLVRHSVSAATAPTQTSSTMNALQTLGMVVNMGNTKYPLWTLTDTPVTTRMKEIVGA
jgi:hypothetical protein